jgi:hypothetical protein
MDGLLGRSWRPAPSPTAHATHDRILNHPRRVQCPACLLERPRGEQNARAGPSVTPSAQPLLLASQCDASFRRAGRARGLLRTAGPCALQEPRARGQQIEHDIRIIVSTPMSLGFICPHCHQVHERCEFRAGSVYCVRPERRNPHRREPRSVWLRLAARARQRSPPPAIASGACLGCHASRPALTCLR